MQTGWHEQTQSLYASADVGFKNTYYLTLTGRNDWPSQLAGPNSHNSSFFYPSVGLSVLMNNLLPQIPQHIMQLVLGQIPDINAINGNLPFCHIIKAGNQPD